MRGLIGGRGARSVDIGVVEQPKALFEAKHVARHLVDHLLVHKPFPHQVLQHLRIAVALHVDVDAGVRGKDRGLALVGCHSVGNHLRYGVPVAHHEAVISPAAAQYVAHQALVASRGGAVDVVERAHECRRTGLGRRLEGGEHHVEQQLIWNPGGVVVLSALGKTIAGEVLGAGSHGCRVRKVVGLVAADHRQTHAGVEQRVLAGALGDAAPAGIARNVHHRREGPADAGCRGFDSGHAGPLLDKRRVPGRGLPKRDGEHGVEAVNYVAGKHQGDAQARIFNRLALQRVGHLGVDLVDDGAHAALRHGGGKRVKLSGVILVELPDFLAESHSLQQRLHAGFPAEIA